MKRKLACSTFLLLFVFISTGYGQENNPLKISALGKIFPLAEQVNSQEKDRGICYSPNGMYRGEYSFSESGFDYFEVKEFRLFKNDSLIALIQNPPGVGFYISNSGIVAAVDVTESPGGKGTVTFFSRSGHEIFTSTVRHAHGFKFTENGNWFGAAEQDGLRLVQPVQSKTFSLSGMENK